MTDNLAGAWALPDADDELPHTPSGLRDDLPWKDTYWFSFRDEKHDVTGAVHLTVSANRSPGFRAAVALRHKGAQVLRTVYEVPVRTDDSFGGSLVTLRVLDGHWDTRKHLQLTFDTGDVAGTVELGGRHLGPNLALLCPGLLPSASAVELSGHAEQGTVMTGDIRWAGDALHLEGYGHRDRSWGYRKSDGMNLLGYTFAGVHLPGATLGFLGWQHPNADADAPLPVGVWLADDTGVYPAVDGYYRRSAEGRPESCAFTLSDGRRVEARTVEPTAELFYAYHEPELDGPAIGTFSWDQHVIMDSPDGPARGIFNHGSAFMADVFRNARFCAADQP
jgi:hypothetical protein